MWDFSERFLFCIKWLENKIVNCNHLLWLRLSMKTTQRFGLLDGSSSSVTAASLIRLPPRAGPHFNWNDCCGARIRGGAASGAAAAPPDAAIDNTWHSAWPQWATRRSQLAQVWLRNCWPTDIINISDNQTVHYFHYWILCIKLSLETNGLVGERRG